jgi:hypothetical protein
VERNTVVADGTPPWSIGVRFAGAFATIRDNATTRQILLRDGARADMEGNILLPFPARKEQ